jgi:hypothetical protein
MKKPCNGCIHPGWNGVAETEQYLATGWIVGMPQPRLGLANSEYRMYGKHPLRYATWSLEPSCGNQYQTRSGRMGGAPKSALYDEETFDFNDLEWGKLECAVTPGCKFYLRPSGPAIYAKRLCDHIRACGR